MQHKSKTDNKKAETSSHVSALNSLS